MTPETSPFSPAVSTSDADRPADNQLTETEMKSKWIATTLFVLAVGIVGCTQNSTTTSETGHDNDHAAHDGQPGVIEAPVAPSAEGEKYVLTSEPSEVQTVIDVRQSAKNNDEVVLVGKIGGSENPWIEGRAIFTLVDESLKSCDQIPGDNCPVPWDYCCATDKLKDASALITMVDENGKPIKIDARELLGVRELTQVVVKGKAKRDDAGNLTILANGVFVKK